MFIIITLLLTVLVSGIFGAVPAVVSRRRVSRRDAAWAAGLWLAVWVFALCAYHRPGLTVGFHAFRLVLSDFPYQPRKVPVQYAVAYFQ